MAQIQVLDQRQRQGTDISASAVIPDGVNSVAVTAVMNDVDILNPDVSLRMSLEVSPDNGKTWQGLVAANWQGGPENKPKVPGNPIPRPSTGTIDVTGFVGWRVRGTLDCPTRIALGAVVDVN